MYVVLRCVYRSADWRRKLACRLSEPDCVWSHKLLFGLLPSVSGYLVRLRVDVVGSEIRVVTCKGAEDVRV